MAERPSPECLQRLLAVSALLEGDLTPEHARLLEQHLETCACCARLAESLRQTIQLCKGAETRSLPADVQARARARVRALLGG
jgi:anti-sigma factor RsiW